MKWNFSDKRSCLSVHIMDTVRTQQYAILQSAYCSWCWRDLHRETCGTICSTGGHPQKQHTSLQNRKITFFHTDIYREPDSSLCHKVYQKHNQANLYVKLGPHKHHSNKQATYHTVWLSCMCSYPNVWAVLIHIIWTHYVAQCWEQVPAEFRITLIVMQRLEQEEIFDFHLACHATLVQQKL